MKVKEQLLREKLEAAWNRFSRPETSESDVKCAADLIVEKEVKLAAKEGRPPQYDTPIIRDELFGFLQAGHETTASTVMWALKYLTKYQHVQNKLRRTLKETFSSQAGKSEPPSSADIAKAPLAYLDAVIEEVMRSSGIVAANIRTTMQDTEIFGHRIPKGTDVFLLVRSFQTVASSF